MADSKISALTALTGATIATNDELAIVDTSAVETKRITVTEFLTGILGSTSITGATVTTSQPLLNLAQTWNAGAVTFTGLKLNVTDTTSASASLLLDLQVGGSSKFSVTKAGTLAISGNATFGSSSTFSQFGNVGINYVGSDQINLSSTCIIGWGSGSVASAADVILGRNAAASLRLGAADAAAPVAQTLGVQSVVAGTSNTAGTNFTIKGSAGTGTGAGGSIIFQVAPAGSTGTAQNSFSTALTIATTAITAQNHLLFSADNTYDIGASGATRPRSVYVGTSVFIGSGTSISSGVMLNNNFNNQDNSVTLWAFSNGSSNATFSVASATPLMRFAGTTSSFPALKRSSAALQARLADDSAFAAIQGKLTTDTNYTAGSAGAATGYIVIYDATGTAYKVEARV